MKIQGEREKLLRAFQLVAGVAPARSPKPILQNVKLEAAANTVTLMGTDLEVGIRIELGGLEVEAEGQVVLPRDRFGMILREMADETLRIESDGMRILAEGQYGKFQLPAEDPNEYPNIRGFEEENYHELSAQFFREMVKRTAFATDIESSRYALGGILLEIDGNEVIAVGTDGRRLARQIGPAEPVGQGGASENTTIVPTRAMQLIERALGDHEESVCLAAHENEVLVRSQQTTLYSRLVEGRFPNWRGVFPQAEKTHKIDLSVGPFHAAVRQAAITTSDDHRGVDFHFGEGKLLLAGHGAELGESQIELPVSFEGPPVSIKLDPRFLMDFLRVLDADGTFVLELKDEETAAVFSTDDGYAYVVMPLAMHQP